MAVTMTAAELVAALRLGDSAEELTEVTRILAFVSEAVFKYAPGASDVAHTEAARRMAGYLYDQPEAARGDSYANAMRNSGAARMLFAFRAHRLGIADAVEVAQAAIGTVANPVTDVSYSGDLLTVTYADGQEEEFTIAGGSGTDQTARDSAGDAQTRADEAYAKADDAVEPVANELAAMTDGDRSGVLYLFDGGIRYNGETYLSGDSGPTYTHLASGHLNNIRAGFSFTATEAAALRAAWIISHHLEFRFKLSGAQFVTREVRTVPRPLPSTPIQVYAGIATSTAGETKIVDFTLTDTSAGVGTGIDNTWPTGATLEVYGVS